MRRIRTIICLMGLLALLCTSGRAQIVGPPTVGPGGGAPISPGSLTAPVGSAGTIAQYSVNSVLNVKSPAYNASGSANTYTGTIASGSSSLLLTASGDFAVGQYVGVPLAGQASPLTTSTFATGTVTNLGIATGTDTVCYKIATGDPAEGIHDVLASEKNATAPLPLSPDWLSNTAYTTNVSYVYPLIGNPGSYVYLATTGGTSNAATVVPTALAEVGNIVTVTVANTFAAKQAVVMAGNTPAGYNGTFTILTAAAGNFTYYNPTTGLGAGSVFGTAINGPAFSGAQTVGNTVTDGSVTWTNEGPVFSSGAGLNVSFTGNSQANTVYGVYRDGPEATDCNLDANSAYKFIGTVNASSYKDYGSDSPKQWDWPATTPVTRNETAYGKITAITTTTNPNDTLALDFTASQGQATAVNTATAVTVRHDDTVGVQAAYDAAGTAGTQVYWPKGTYRMDMVMLKSPSTGARDGYWFTAATLADNAAGMIQIEGNKIRTTGAGQDKTFLVSDWAFVANVRDVMFNVATLATIAGYNGPETSGGSPRWANYPINPVPRSSYCFMLVTPSNQSNFSVGDYVYLTGGGAINGTYHIANISPVTSVGQGGATGQICIRDAVTSDIPFGVVGQAPYVENLTTNAVVQDDMTFEDMTISSGASSFSFVDNYNLTWQNLNYPEIPSNPLSSEFNYGQWGEKVVLRNSNIVVAFQEFPVDAYLDINHDQWRIIQPVNKLAFDGASSTLDFTNNLVELGCGSQVVDEQTEPEVHIIANKIVSVCPTGGSAQDGGLFVWGTSATIPIGYDHIVSDNEFVTNEKTVVNIGASSTLPPNTLFANNTITWLHGPFNSPAMAFGGSAKVIGNKMYNIQLNAATGATGISILTPTSGAAPSVQNNTIIDVANGDIQGINISDPGVAYTNPIAISNNVCDGCFKGIAVVGTNATKVIMSGNEYKGTGAPITPTNLAYAVGCGHGSSPPSPGTGTLTSGSTDCAFEVTGSTTYPLTVTFSSGYNIKPVCTCIDETTAVAFKAVPSSTSVIITGMTNNDSVMCQCPQSEGRSN